MTAAHADVSDIDDVLAQLEEVGEPTTEADGGTTWVARCPHPDHPDLHPGYAVTLKPDGSIVCVCRSRRCEVIPQHLVLPPRPLRPGAPTSAPGVTCGTKIHPYTDASGNLLFEQLRDVDEAGNKTGIRPRQPDPSRPDGWRYDLAGLGKEVKSILYRKSQVEAAIKAEEPVYLTEGESDADAGAEHGMCTTTNLGGAGALNELHTKQLEGARLRVLLDNDGSGIQRAQKAQRLFKDVVKSLKFYKPAVDEPKADLRDHLEAGYSVDDLVEVLPNGEPKPKLPPLVSLTELMTRPDVPPTWRVDQLLEEDTRVLLIAPEKAGKTTLINNLLRSLVDGDPFLDHFETTPLPAGRTVVVIDAEMNQTQSTRWLREQGIKDTDRVLMVHLRGRLGQFDIRDKFVRDTWAGVLREAGVGFLIIDCLRPLLDEMGLKESTEAGTFLNAMDSLILESGASEGLLVQHTGHENKDRGRGDSRLGGWADGSWVLAVDEHKNGDESCDGHPPVYFRRPTGRDGWIGETLMSFDEDTRHLSVVGGSRGQAKAQKAADEVLDDILEVLRDATGPLSGNEVAKEAPRTKTKVLEALKYGVSRGLIATEHGIRSNNPTTLYTLPTPGNQPVVPGGSQVVPNHPGGGSGGVVPADPFRGGGNHPPTSDEIASGGSDGDGNHPDGVDVGSSTRPRASWRDIDEDDAPVGPAIPDVAGDLLDDEDEEEL